MDDGSHHRPWSLLFVALLILLPLAGCAKPERSATLALLGDINLGRGVTPAADSLSFLASDLRQSDLALANLESPLAESLPEMTTGYNLCAPAERAVFLSDWGLDLASLANNHRLDCSPEGISETASALEKAGLISIAPDSEPVYQTIHGVKLAFLAFDDITAPLDLNAAAASIRAAHAEGALVIVSIHWGMEYQTGPTDRQQALAKPFAEAGAALIWGHHPHVLQRADWIETSQGKTLVLYSLGNALFDQEGLPDTRESALALVTLDARGVRSIRAIPFIIDVSSSRLIAPSSEESGKILERLKIE